MELHDLRKLLAVGTGVGLEIAGTDLRVLVARVRPNGVRLLGLAHIPQFRERPAAEWGQEYAQFLQKLGAKHLAATLLLPREDVIVRLITLPGVAEKDLGAAVQYQIDSLHPYQEEEATYTWARLGNTASVLVGITRHEVVERYRTLLTEAGIKVASFSFSAAAIYSALRFYHRPPAGFVALAEHADTNEVYGESAAKPVLSAVFDRHTGARAVAQAIAELRLPPEVEPVPLTAVLPVPQTLPDDLALAEQALPYAAALTSACPRLSLSANLLPESQRSGASRWMYVPSLVLAGLLLILGGLSFAQSAIDDRHYIELLDREIHRYQPAAERVTKLEQERDVTRARTQQIDSFRRRSKNDMDAINELTRLLAAPGWLNSLDVDRRNILITGETEQASTLIKTLDASPYFQGSEFNGGVGRNGNLESFRIHATRKGTE